MFFQKKGYKVKIYKGLRKFDAAAAAAKASLLWYHWRQGYKMGAHFVALHKKDGEFIGYNTYKNSVGPDRYGPSLREYIRIVPTPPEYHSISSSEVRDLYLKAAADLRAIRALVPEELDGLIGYLKKETES